MVGSHVELPQAFQTPHLAFFLHQSMEFTSCKHWAELSRFSSTLMAIEKRLRAYTTPKAYEKGRLQVLKERWEPGH